MGDVYKKCIDACARGDCQTVENILSNHDLPIDACDKSGLNLLQIAAAAGHEQLVRLLLVRGANVNACGFLGWTPLMQAARYGQVNTMTVLIQHHADLKAKNFLGVDALTLAARTGSLEAVLLLLQSGAVLTEDVPGSGFVQFNPLMAAAQAGHIGLVRSFIDRGLDVNHATPSTHLTALHLASVNGHVRTVQALIESGASVNEKSFGRTAVDYARCQNRRELEQFLMTRTSLGAQENQQSQPDIFSVIRDGTVDDLLGLLRETPSLRDRVGPGGATPLMETCVKGDPAMVEALVEWGCNLNPCDTEAGWTPLMQAVFYGHNTIAKYLIERGANVSIKAHDGRTAFDIATLVQVEPELLRLLAAHMKTALTKAFSTADLYQPDKRRRSGGVKGLFSRLSGRFRNLRSQSNLSASTTRLAATHSVYSGNKDFVSFTNDFLQPVIPPSIPSAHRKLSQTQSLPPSQTRSTQRTSNFRHFRLNLNQTNSSYRNSSGSDSGSSLTPSNVTPHRTSTTGSTLTPVAPSPSPIEEDELGSLLKRLSLERYQALFEEHEVDMEAALTLEEGDLEELGISQAKSRHDILTAINTIASDKGRERELLRESSLNLAENF